MLDIIQKLCSTFSKVKKAKRSPLVSEGTPAILAGCAEKCPRGAMQPNQQQWEEDYQRPKAFFQSLIKFLFTVKKKQIEKNVWKLCIKMLYE